MLPSNDISKHYCKDWNTEKNENSEEILVLAITVEGVGLRSRSTHRFEAQIVLMPMMVKCNLSDIYSRRYSTSTIVVVKTVFWPKTTIVHKDFVQHFHSTHVFVSFKNTPCYLQMIFQNITVKTGIRRKMRILKKNLFWP